MILVTGGTGLVGAHLLLKLVSEGKSVRAIHRKNNLEKVQEIFAFYHSESEAKRLFNKIEWKKADIIDIPTLTEAFESVDYVYHCAAVVSFRASEEDKIRKINIEGTANVVNLSISFGIKKLCYVSSIATLNKDLSAKEISEKSSWNPERYHSTYAISKYGSEMEVWRGTQEGLPAVIVNPGIIIGPGNWNIGSGPLFTKVDKGLQFYFSKISGFVGVNDVATAMRILMNSEIKNEQFILVSENKNFKDILAKIANELNKPVPKYQLKPWMVKVGWFAQKIAAIFGRKQDLPYNSWKSIFEHSFYSSEKFKKSFNFQFKPINKVLEETASIYRKDKN